MFALIISFILAAITGMFIDRYRIKKNPEKYTEEYFINDTKNRPSDEAIIYTLIYFDIMLIGVIIKEIIL